MNVENVHVLNDAMSKVEELQSSHWVRIFVLGVVVC